MKNTTEGLYPYQLALYDKIATGGFKHSEMFIISAGRRTGKSLLNYYYSNLRNNNLCKEIMFPKLKYKFSRSNWYVADFNWIHQADVVEWCTQQFGPHPKNPDAWSRWCHHYQERIHFRDEKDYAWFILRWT